MYRKATIFGLIVFFIFGLFITDASAQDKKKYYIVFNNFEENVTVDLGDGNTIPLVEHLYFTKLSEDMNYGPYAEIKPFGPSTFASRAITEYDVAIFPLGDVPLHASAGGIKIIDKINEMLDAGKGVIIIGRSYMYQSSQDAASRNFLENELRISHNRYSLMDGNTYVRFDMKGVEGDPVGQGTSVVCNTKYSENGSELAPPFFWYQSADFFTIDESSSAVGFHRVEQAEDGVFAGARWSNTKGGRLVFWSVGFDVATKIHDDKLGTMLNYAIAWITERYLKPEQWIEAEIGHLNFEKVDPGEFKVDEVRIRNFGKEDLTITNTYIEAFFSDEGVYEISEGAVTPDNPKTLAPNEFFTIKVKFAPPAEELYDDALIIESNATNTNSLTITLEGQGGEQVEKGPRISEYDFPVDFGELYVGEQVDKYIDLTNTGNVSLMVFTLDTTINEAGAFLYPESIKTPMVIPVGETEKIKIRFFPLKDNRTYHGQIKVTSNANNIDTMYIDLIGKTLEDKFGPEAECETEELIWGEVDTSSYEDKVFTISSEGDMDLLVSDIYVDGDNETKQVFQITNGDEASIPPGESHEVIVRFKPIKDQVYSSELVILCNANVNDKFYIDLFGRGVVSVNENGEAGFNNEFRMKLSENPVSDNTNLIYSIESNTVNHLKLKMLDAMGNKVKTIFDESVTPGDFNLNINVSDLSSGAYYIVAEINGKTTMLPLMVTK